MREAKFLRSLGHDASVSKRPYIGYSVTYPERQTMKDQHTKISGYRGLNQTEIDLMNEAKAIEAQVLAFHQRIDDYLAETFLDNKERQFQAQARRWLAIARTDLETGFMALVRSIAQPQPKA